MRGGIVAAAAGIVALALGAPPARSAELSEALAQLYASVSINPPTAERMTICYGFVCRRRYIFDFTAADYKKLSEFLAAGGASAARSAAVRSSPGRSSPGRSAAGGSSAEAERKAVQQAVAWFDRRIGPVIGTDSRIAYADFRYFDDKHNFDCYDTTRNTTSLLLVLQEWGLLRHHVVADPRYRGNFFVLQTPHNTAVLTERATGQNWVVDMWTKAYGELPDVMPVEQWLKEN
jgi:hypothetical protein